MHIMLRGFGLSVMVAAWCANIYVYIYILYDKVSVHEEPVLFDCWLPLALTSGA